MERKRTTVPGSWVSQGLIAFACIFTALTAPSIADGAQKFGPDYERQVAPILKKYCSGCHNADDAEGGLVMDSFAELQDGGRNGSPFVPGKSGESLLVLLVEGKRKPVMPPKDNPKPSKSEIDTLKAWIDAGAKGPAHKKPTSTELVVPVLKPSAPPKPSVQAIAFAPDGGLVAVAGYRSVTLADANTGVIRHILGDHAGAVTSVTFSRDGATVLSASGQPGLFGEAKLWKLSDGATLRHIKGHQDSLYAAEFSPDGKLVATAGYDRQIILWNASDGTKVRTLAGHNDAVYALAFRPDGKLLASASGDRTVKLWDVAAGKRLDTFSQPIKEQYTVAFHPEGRHLAAGGGDKRIRVWEISATGREGSNPILVSRFAHEGPVIRLVYSADGKTLVSSAEDRTIKLWDAVAMREKHLLEKQSDWAGALAFAPNGQALLAGRHDGTMAYYATASGSKQRDFAAVAPPPELVAVEPRGIQRGLTTRVKLAGKNLADIATAKFSDKRLVGRVLLDPKPVSAEVWIEVTASGDLDRGKYEIAVTGPGGSSRNLQLFVDDLRQVVEAEPNNATTKANAISLPATFWGALAHAGDTDCFGFELKKSETIVLDVAAAQIGSKLNGVLTVADPSGHALASSNDFDGQTDPLLVFTAPVAGRYSAQLSDLQLGGSAEHFYRVSVGAFPFVTGTYPLSVPANSKSRIEFVGENLPAGSGTTFTSGAEGEATVPIDLNQFRNRAALRVLVGANPLMEREPNDHPPQATNVKAPAVVNARIAADGNQAADVDLFGFDAKAGETWIIETDAARRGSPIDTRLEVLSVAGQPIERVWLQATRDSMVAFRAINSTQLELRCDNWEEMELNQLMYMQGEVCKLFRMPQGPDSGFLFYGRGGQRVTFFDTTATTHALEDPCYVVEPHPPGTNLVPTGLPVFRLTYANDDSGDRRLSRDSRLTFRAPADGRYLIRVRDARGRSGNRMTYRVVIRRPQPDFSVSIEGSNPKINVGSGQQITFHAERMDGFEDQISLQATSLPTGYRISQPLVIEAGHSQAFATLYADETAAPIAANAPAIKITATAMIGGKSISKEVGSLGSISLAPKPRIRVRLDPAEVTVAPGGEATAYLKVERNGFDGRIQFDINNLPHGVIVDNIGLSGVLIPEGQTERQIFIAARPWVPETSRPCFAIARAEGNQTSMPVMVNVRRPSQLAKASSP